MMFRSTRADADEILETVTSSAAFRSAKAERDAAVTAERTSLVRSLRQLEGDAERDFRPLNKAMSEAESAVNDAIAAMDKIAVMAARQKLWEATMASSRASQAFDRAHDEIEAKLKATASQAIVDFLHELGGLHYVAARRLPSYPTVGVERKNPVTGRKTIKAEPVALTSLEAINIVEEARVAAEALLLEPDQSDVPARLAQLRATFPHALLEAARR